MIASPRNALPSNNGQQFSAIAADMDRAAKTNDDIMFMRLDRELNRLITAAAQNDYAARAMRFLQGHSRRFWYLHYKQAADLPLCARLHANQAPCRRGRRQ